MNGVLEFVISNPDAAMITVGRDGTPHAARVELGVVDGRIRSSGSPTLVRTSNLRRDPRCTLFVFGPSPRWLAITTTARILDGPDAADHSLALLCARHGTDPASGFVQAHDDHIGRDRPYTVTEYRQHVQKMGLFVFDFDVVRAYGNP